MENIIDRASLICNFSLALLVFEKKGSDQALMEQERLALAGASNCLRNVVFVLLLVCFFPETTVARRCSTKNSLTTPAFSHHYRRPVFSFVTRMADPNNDYVLQQQPQSTRGGVLHLPPNELLQRIKFLDHDANNSLWNIYLRQRLSSLAAMECIWIATGSSCNSNDTTTIDIQSVAQIEFTKPGRGWIRLFCRNAQDATVSAAAMVVVDAAIDLILEEKTTANSKQDEKVTNTAGGVVLGFGALDRQLIPNLRAFLQSKYKVKNSWETPCGMWIYQPNESNDNNNDNNSNQQDEEAKIELPSHSIVRPLTAKDAALVNSRWEYSSGDDSLAMIQDMIADSETTFGGCFGLEIDSILVAWICRYLDGSLGMLWTEEEHRRKGYGAVVVRAAVESILERRRLSASLGSNNNNENNFSTTLIGFTVDNNNASRGLLAKLGWRRVADSDWTGFSLVKEKQ